MYKDKERQREAVRDATRRYRLRKQGITKVSQEQGITEPSVTVSQESMVIPNDTPFTITPDIRTDTLEQPIITMTTPEPKITTGVKPQSYNPMMVGYVPPEAE